MYLHMQWHDAWDLLYIHKQNLEGMMRGLVDKTKNVLLIIEADQST